MDQNEQYIKELETKNQQLESEIEAYKDTAARTKQLKWWTAKKFTGILLGRNLKTSVKKSLDEFSEDRRISKNTLSDLIAALIRRFVRIGFITLLLALLPTAILVIQTYLLNQQNRRIDVQNNLITNQNRRLDQQTYLQEAERRSALIFIYGNLLETIDREIRENEEKTGKRSLSPQTIGQIVALSQRLKPYRYLENDTLISQALSPERSQLLISLVKSDLDSSTYLEIYKNANFSYADLEQANLEGEDLRYINLNHANLAKANLRRAKLGFSNLQSIRLDSTDFVSANLFLSTLNDSEIRNSNFQFANLKSTSFKNCSINKSKFNNANLCNSSFENSTIDSTFFNGASFNNDLEITTVIDYSDFPSVFIPTLSGFFDTTRQQLDTSRYRKSSFIFATLRNTYFIHANLANVIFRSSKIENSYFNSSNLSGASFDSTHVNNIEFSFSFINGTSFNGTDLTAIDFTEAVFPNVVLQPSDESEKPNLFIEDEFFWWVPVERRFLEFDSLYQKKLIDSIMKIRHYDLDPINHPEGLSTDLTVYQNGKSIQLGLPFGWEYFINSYFEDSMRVNIFQLK